MTSRRGTGRALICLALLSACSHRSAHRTSSVARGTKPGSALVSEIASAHDRYTVALVEDQGISAWTGQVIRVAAGATIDNITPIEVPLFVRLLDVRMTYLHKATGTTLPNAYLGSGCIDGWPPAGLGPSFEPHGVQVRAGDEITVNYYVQGIRPGHGLVRGTVVTYAVNGVRYSQPFDNFDDEVYVVSSDNDPLLKRYPCDPVLPKWTIPPPPG
jgi:hypothetical protein